MSTPTSAVGAADSPSSRTRAAVLEATAALLAEGGLASTTIDAIRDRSGVSKTTIYKHWPNRVCVAVDAFAERLAVEASLPDTGTAGDDFREQVRRVSAFYASPIGGVLTQLWASSLQDAEAAMWFRTRLLASRHLGINVLWQRAAARDEVRTDISPDLAMDLLFGPVMWRVLNGRPPLSEAEVDVVVGSVLR